MEIKNNTKRINKQDIENKINAAFDIDKEWEKDMKYISKNEEESHNEKCILPKWI